MDRAFQVGDRVWGLYRNGRWYPATIAEARGDGRFVLSWDDGDSEDRVKAAAEVGRVVSAVGGWAGLGAPPSARGPSRMLAGTHTRRAHTHTHGTHKRARALWLHCLQPGRRRSHSRRLAARARARSARVACTRALAPSGLPSIFGRAAAACEADTAKRRSDGRSGGGRCAQASAARAHAQRASKTRK